MLIIAFYVVLVLLYSIGGGATYKAIKNNNKDACEYLSGL